MTKLKKEARILSPPDWKAEQKAAKAVHVEFPIFGKKMLCGRLLRDFVRGEQYIWTQKDDISCSACRKEARRLKLLAITKYFEHGEHVKEGIYISLTKLRTVLTKARQGDAVDKR